MTKRLMKEQKSSKRGFTLLELVVVLAIMVMFLGTAFYGSTYALKKYKEDIRINRDHLEFEKDAQDDMNNYQNQDVPGVSTATPTPIPSATPTPEPTPTTAPVHQNNGNGNSGNVIHGSSTDVTSSCSISYNAWDSGMNVTVTVPNVTPNNCSNVVITVAFDFADKKAKIDPVHSYGNYSGGHYSNGTLTINAAGNNIYNLSGGGYIGLSGRNLTGTTARIVSVQVVS